MISSRLRVAHVNQRFFPRSETFVYRLIANASRTQPVLVAKEYLYQDEFRLASTEQYLWPVETASLWGRCRKLTDRMLKRNGRLEHLLRGLSVDLIHAHFGTTAAEILPVKRRLGMPMITTFYGYDMSRIAQDQDYVRRYYQPLFCEGDLFLVEGPHMKQSLASLGCPEHKIYVHPISVDLKQMRFQPRQAHCGDVKFVFSGRFTEKKGLMMALKAFAELKRVRSDFRFDIIGDGEQRADVEECVRRSGLAKHVRLLGFLNYQDYIAVMGQADVFIHPSHRAADGDSEGGAPTTILEAQAIGLPVVASDHADIPFVTVPGHSALLAKERDCCDLVDKILLMMDRREEWATMGEVGRKHVEKQHSIHALLPVLEDVYERTCQPAL
jgi:colanic acid/amylovoran biosynthesis glycosyltransferase